MRARLFPRQWRRPSAPCCANGAGGWPRTGRPPEQAGTTGSATGRRQLGRQGRAHPCIQLDYRDHRDRLRPYGRVERLVVVQIGAHRPRLVGRPTATPPDRTVRLPGPRVELGDLARHTDQAPERLPRHRREGEPAAGAAGGLSGVLLRAPDSMASPAAGGRSAADPSPRPDSRCTPFSPSAMARHMPTLSGSSYAQSPSYDGTPNMTNTYGTWTTRSATCHTRRHSVKRTRHTAPPVILVDRGRRSTTTPASLPTSGCTSPRPRASSPRPGLRRALTARSWCSRRWARAPPPTAPGWPSSG